jgi:hypothetical protein
MTKTRREMKDRRKPYRKPQVEQVEVVPEEAVLGGCKVPGVFGGTDPIYVEDCLAETGPCYTQLLS